MEERRRRRGARTSALIYVVDSHRIASAPTPVARLKQASTLSQCDCSGYVHHVATYVRHAEPWSNWRYALNAPELWTVHEELTEHARRDL